MARKNAAEESRLGTGGLLGSDESQLGERGFRGAGQESRLAQERGERDLARSLTQLGAQHALATAAFRRAYVREATDDGRYVVSYRGQDITVSAGGFRGGFVEGQWVTIGLVEGTLEITGPSAYGGGAVP